MYKRIKSGRTKLLDICEVPVVDLAESKGANTRTKWKDVPEPEKMPFQKKVEKYFVGTEKRTIFVLSN